MLRTIGRWIAYPLIAGVLAVILSIVMASVKGQSRDLDSSFEVTSFDATYVLEPQDDGSLDVLITETLQVDIQHTGKHGIIRAIPLTFQSHENELSDVEVEGRLRDVNEYYESGEAETPQEWTPASFSEEDIDGGIALRIGSSYSTLETGEQFYRISYRLADVAMNTPDGTAQEVALDANGTGWGVPFGSVTTKLTVPAGLAERLNGNAACYMGSEGDRATCSVERTGDGPVVFTSGARGFEPHQSLTFAVGFEPGTFSQAYTPQRGLYTALIVMAVPVGAALLILLGVVLPPLVRRAWLNRRVLVTEFQPPRGVEPVVAADVWGVPERGMAAQLIQAVVTKQISIVTPEDAASEAQAGMSKWRQAKQRRQLRESIRFEGIDTLDDRGVGALLRGQFRYGLSSGPSDTLVQRRRSLVEESGMRFGRYKEAGSWFLPTYIFGLFALAIFNLIALNISLEITGWNILMTVVAVLLLVIALYRTQPMGPLTEKGKDVYQHLRGLRHFMAMSEADRIAYLQGTDTAPRVARGDETLIKLYEPLLPYAVIFGIEESWGRLIGEQHDQVPTAGSVAPLVNAYLLTDMLHSYNYSSHRSYDHAMTLSSANDRASDGFSSAGGALSDMFAGSNDGSGGGGWSGGGGGGGGSWSSGSSGGGGSVGGGMGGGGGSSW